MKQKLFPTLRDYKKTYLSKDIFAGLIVAAMSIPISMGYAQIAGLPAVYGLYGSVLPLVMFALFSTSRQFIFGVDAAPAAIIGSSLASMGIVSGSAEAIKTVPVIAMMTGVWLLLFYIMKAGSVVGFISTPVMGGFISGIAVTIIMMQIPKLMGGDAVSGELFHLAAGIIKAAGDVHWLSLLLGTVTLAVILLSKRFFPKFPMAVVVMLVGALAAYYGHIDQYGVRLLASVDRGLFPLRFPDAAGADIKACLGTSLTVAVVIMAETLLAENNFAFKNSYKLNDNAEILACAMGNIVASLSGCCSVNGSVSRTAMAEQFGGKTQMMSLVAAGALVLLLLFGTAFIGYLPVPVLTAIVISALLGVVEFHLAARLYRVSRSEFWIFMGAFAGVLVMGTIYGVVIGIVLSFAEVVLRAAKPTRLYLGVLPGHKNFYDLSRNAGARPIEHVLIYQFCDNLFFANVSVLQEDIERNITEDTQCVVLDARSISSIDITAADRLELLYKNLRAKHIKFYMAEHTARVNEQLRCLGFGYLIEQGFVRRTITLALKDAGFERPYMLEGQRETETAESMVFYSRDMETLAEYEWAYGADAEKQMEKEVLEMIANMAEKDLHGGTMADEDIDKILHSAHIWTSLGTIDEDELLRRLELHVRELAECLNRNETAITYSLEARRKEIAEHLREVNPQAVQRLLEHQKKLEEHLKESNPAAYEYLRHLRRDDKDSVVQ